jgi:hypothetical protein
MYTDMLRQLAECVLCCAMPCSFSVALFCSACVSSVFCHSLISSTIHFLCIKEAVQILYTCQLRRSFVAQPYKCTEWQ